MKLTPNRLRLHGIGAPQGRLLLQPGSGLVDGHGSQGPVALLVELGEFMFVVDTSGFRLVVSLGVVPAAPPARVIRKTPGHASIRLPTALWHAIILASWWPRKARRSVA